MVYSVAHVPPFHQMWKSVEQFLRNPANKLTNADENITSLAEIIEIIKAHLGYRRHRNHKYSRTKPWRANRSVYHLDVRTWTRNLCCMRMNLREYRPKNQLELMLSTVTDAILVKQHERETYRHRLEPINEGWLRRPNVAS